MSMPASGNLPANDNTDRFAAEKGQNVQNSDRNLKAIKIQLQKKYSELEF